MSSDEEIRAVYEQDIADKTRLVYGKSGAMPFYDGFSGFQVEELFQELGIEKIVCSEYTPKTRKWSKK